MCERKVHLEQLLPLIRERLEAGQDVRFTPRGISMQPMLRNGQDTVLLTPVRARLKKYDLPLYRRKDGQFVLHRIVRVQGNSYTCIGDNQFVPEPGIEHDQVIAVVRSFTRKGKSWSVTSPIYGLYCRMWHYSRPLRHFWRRGLGWIRRSFVG